MKNVSQMVKTNSEIQSFDITEDFNKEKGNLNSIDGIDCPRCNNKGYILVDDENGVTQTFVPCECMKKRKSLRISKESGLGELLKYRVKDFIADADWQKRAKALVIDYIQNATDEWLCILGQSGSGKTHLCSAVCNYRIEQQREVRYVSWNDFTKQYKDAFKNNSNKAVIKELEEVDILYIDDLFKGSTSEYDVKNICYDIINYRYNNKKTTIISSEYDFSELNEIDNAIAGRIKQMCKKYLMIVRRTDENNYRLKGE